MLNKKTKKVILVLSLFLLTSATLYFIFAKIQASQAQSVYDEFNNFAIQNFGAEKEPLIYEKFGNTLKFLSDGDWVYPSERSAAIGFETNLPSKTYIEYGLTSSYGQTTQDQTEERYFYLHLDRTFTTRSTSGVIHIPQDVSGPPYVLNQAGATYVLTQDITAEDTAFIITASNITLDLGGNTVIYNNTAKDIKGDWLYCRNNGEYGIRSQNNTDLKIFNGTIRQGSNSGGCNDSGISFNPIYINGGNNDEIAGVTVDYSGSQLSGIFNHWAGNTHEVHHNIILDRGTIITNRHQGQAAIAYGGGEANVQNAFVHHNLVKRARQYGLKGNNFEDNEVYLDSVATNSFGISGTIRSDGYGYSARNNRVFGTGYHPIGFDWGNQLDIRDNFVHMQGQGPKQQPNADYGNQEEMAGIRLTQYGNAHQPYYNNVYENNLIVIKGLQCNSLGCSDGKGVHIFSDPDVQNLQFKNNIVKVMADDTFIVNKGDAAPIVTEGKGDVTGEAPVFYLDNILISNITNIQFGSNYGGGSNHRFIRNTLVKKGSRSDYATFRFDDFIYYNKNNKDLIIRDNLYEGGASQDNVKFSSSGQVLTFEWTLNVRVQNSSGNPVSGVSIAIKDKNGNQVASGTTNSNGDYSVPLKQYIHRQSGKEYYTPHTVTVSSGSWSTTQTITMDKKKTLTCTVGQSSCTESTGGNGGNGGKTGDLDSDGDVDIFDLLALLSKWGSSDSSADLNA